jgi:hypothetical protein
MATKKHHTPEQIIHLLGGVVLLRRHRVPSRSPGGIVTAPVDSVQGGRSARTIPSIARGVPGRSTQDRGVQPGSILSVIGKSIRGPPADTWYSRARRCGDRSGDSAPILASHRGALRAAGTSCETGTWLSLFTCSERLGGRSSTSDHVERLPRGSPEHHRTDRRGKDRLRPTGHRLTGEVALGQYDSVGSRPRGFRQNYRYGNGGRVDRRVKSSLDPPPPPYPGVTPERTG